MEAADRLEALNTLARGLIELMLDPQAKTPAERAERRNETKAKLFDTLDAITAYAQASLAQAEASEAYCHLFTGGSPFGATGSAQSPNPAAKGPAQSEVDPPAPKDARS